MSSYLNIYIKAKDTLEPIHIMSFSRSHPMYEFFYENGLSVYGYNNDSGTVYQQLDSALFKGYLQDYRNEVAKDEKLMESLKEFSGIKGCDVSYIKSQLEYINGRKEAIREIEAIEFLIDNCEFTDIEYIETNYD